MKRLTICTLMTFCLLLAACALSADSVQFTWTPPPVSNVAGQVLAKYVLLDVPSATYVWGTGAQPTPLADIPATATSFVYTRASNYPAGQEHFAFISVDNLGIQSALSNILTVAFSTALIYPQPPPLAPPGNAWGSWKTRTIP